MTDEPVKETMMDKHIGAILQALILATILGVAGMIYTQNETMHSMDKNLALVQQQVKGLTDSQSNYLTKNEADNRGKIRDAKEDAILQRQNDMQERINSMETQVTDIIKKITK